MIGEGKTVGTILIIAGIVIFVGASLFVSSGLLRGETNLPATILGISVCGGIPLVLLAGVGAFLFVRGGAEQREFAQVQKKERLLGMIQAQGKVSLNTIMIEQHMTREQVRNDIYELVQQGLFTGYIDWPS